MYKAVFLIGILYDLLDILGENTWMWVFNRDLLVKMATFSLVVLLRCWVVILVAVKLAFLSQCVSVPPIGIWHKNTISCGFKYPHTHYI